MFIPRNRCEGSSMCSSVLAPTRTASLLRVQPGDQAPAGAVGRGRSERQPSWPLASHAGVRQYPDQNGRRWSRDPDASPACRSRPVSVHGWARKPGTCILRAGLALPTEREAQSKRTVSSRVECVMTGILSTV